MSEAETQARPGLDSLAWYRTMRQTAPVTRDPDAGCWNVYRYRDAALVLSDHRTYSSDFSALFRHPSSAEGGIGTMDPPRHQQLRGVVSHAFSPRAIARLEARCQELADGLLDQVQGLARLELMAAFAHPLPVIVIAELLGVPAEDRARFRTWMDALLAVNALSLADPATAERATAAMAAFHDYLREHIALRRARPRQDLLSTLVTARLDDGTLSDEQVAGFATELLVAGQLTTATLIGNAVLCLDEHPDAQAALRAAPGGVPAAIEEVLRYRSPIIQQDRLTTTGVRLGDALIEPRQVLRVCLLSANHDELQFEEPDRFVAGRRPNAHLGFGKGIHFCLGAPLARLEAAVALTALLRRYRHLAVDRDRQVEYAGSGANGAQVGSTTILGLTRLHVLAESAA
jgi:cytochrome P450